MYNNLIEEDIMILDNEFFKIDTMFESVDKMYDIKQRELEYNYIYTESINEEYVDLYTEAEVAKDKKEQGLLGRLFTAILNFIRKIRAKILRFFGNDKKASELEAKIKGNPKLANQTVEITNTVDAEKAIDEGTSFFGSLIDKIVKGTATEADADDAEEKNKSLLSRIGIFAGGALLAAGGAKVTSDKLKERGVTKQTIKEAVSNLLKREEDTKKKSNEVTQTNEQNVQKAQQAMNNNSQNGNEENTKAGRRIMGSFKDFITGAGKFFTGKASELKSKINGVSSNNNDDKKKDSTKDDTSEKKDNKNNEVNKKQEQVKTKSDKSEETQSKTKPETKSDKPEETQSKTKPEDKVEKQPETSTTDTTEQKNGKNDKTKPETKSDKPEETQSKTKPEDKVEKQPETSTTDTTEQKNGKNDKTKPETKSDNKDHELSSKEKIDGEIRRLLNKFSNYVYFNSPSLLTLSPMKQYVEKGFSIVSPEDQPKANFQVIDEIFDFEPETIVKVAKRILDSYSIYSKYKNPDKNKVEEALKNQLRYNKIDYSDVDREMDDIKTTFTTLDKYAKELNELIKKRETFKESTYDLINDILTIFENSF